VQELAGPVGALNPNKPDELSSSLELQPAKTMVAAKTANSRYSFILFVLQKYLFSYKTYDFTSIRTSTFKLTNRVSNVRSNNVTTRLISVVH
jgi:hypothetical protein